MLEPATDTGVYCSNSIVDGVLKIETTSVDAVSGPKLLLTVTVLLMMTACDIAGVINMTDSIMAPARDDK